MSSETSLTQGMEGEIGCYGILNDIGFEVKRWGDDRNLDLVGIFKRKNLCPPDNLPRDEEVFFSVSTQRTKYIDKIKDTIKKKEENGYSNAVCILKNVILNKKNYTKFNKDGLNVWDNLKLNFYDAKSSDIALLNFRYGLVTEIRLTDKCSMLYGFPEYNNKEKSFFIDSIIYYEDLFGELKYEETKEFINMINSYFIELHEGLEIQKLKISFHVKYIFQMERNLTPRMNDYFKDNHMNYSILKTTDKQIISGLVGDSNGE